VFENDFDSVWWFVLLSSSLPLLLRASLVICFIEFFTPFTLGGHNFLDYNPFLTIVSVSDVTREGVQVLFGHHWTPETTELSPEIWPALSA
jgi:hypothetical protein